MHELCQATWGIHNAGGTSEWTAQQLTEAWSVSKRLNLVGPAFEQPEYSLLAREKVHSGPRSALTLFTFAAGEGSLADLASSWADTLLDPRHWHAFEGMHEAGRMPSIKGTAQERQHGRAQVEKDYLPLYKEVGLGLTTWSPLASGLLTGKYSKGHVPEGSRLAMEMYKVWTFIHSPALAGGCRQMQEYLKPTCKARGLFAPSCNGRDFRPIDVLEG